MSDSSTTISSLCGRCQFERWWIISGQVNKLHVSMNFCAFNWNYRCWWPRKFNFQQLTWFEWIIDGKINQLHLPGWLSIGKLCVESAIKSNVEMFIMLPQNTSCQGFPVQPYDFWEAYEKLHDSVIKRFLWVANSQTRRCFGDESEWSLS